MEFATDSGYVDVKVGDKAAQLDVYEANNKYAALQDEHGQDAVSLGNAWKEWLASKGLDVSHSLGYRIADGILAKVQEIKKEQG